MDSRHYRSSSPRRHANPARASTGTFGEPYYDSTYYNNRPSSPRSSVDRIAASHHQPYYTPPTTASSTSRTSSLKHDSYTGRPRSNTADRMARPNSSSLNTTTLPLRTPFSNFDRPSSPLTKPFDTRGDTYITPGPSRREHKKIYSVDDSSHTAQLVAEKEIIESKRHRDSTGGYSVTSGGRSYHNTNPPARHTDISDEGYSYTDPASMYRDTEPAWRRPRTGSIERSSRPSSMIVDRSARSSARELGPPPSTRGFDKIISNIPRVLHGRASSIDRTRDVPKYDSYADAIPARTSSTRHHVPAIHQEPPRVEPREHRRDPYADDYDRRSREVENRRHNSVDRFEDREIASRGFGIAPNPNLAHDHHAVDRQPIWNASEVPRSRPEEGGPQYYAPERADARMPDPHVPRERAPVPAPAPAYPSHVEERPREREESRRGAIPVAAGAVAGVAATLGAAGLVKSRERERERERERDRERESDRDSSGERERRKQWDERDRRDRYEDRRDRGPDERRERPDERRDERRGKRSDERRESPPGTPSTAIAASGAYPSPPDTDRKTREVRHEDEAKSRSTRKAPSPEGSSDERPRHYVKPETDRRIDTVSQEAAIDPDEEYRRRVQQEAERSGRTARDRDSDSERERERDRRRRKEERSRSRAREERSSTVYDSKMVQEPESMDKPANEQPSKAVQIVEPKDSPPPIKGILRKPTEKFPEHPEPIREGVAPHKDSLKGKDIPIGARWTRIDRKLVNPEALEQAKERFEERADCVIVLRVLTKEEIQKLADRTKKIRDAREDEYEREHRDRDRRGHRSYRDDEERDRDRRRRYEEDDYSDRDEVLRDRERERERERERDRPRMLEPAR